MSETTTSTTPAADSLKSPTFIVTVLLILLVAGTVYGVFRQSSPEVQSTIAGSLVTGIIGGLTGYFYGASKHGPPGQSPPGTVTTTAVPASTTTTTTEIGPMPETETKPRSTQP